MKVKELRELLNNPHSLKHDEDEVSIRLSDPSIGPIAMTGVRSAGFGFDWESGHFILFPQKEIVTLKEKEALWQAAHDFIYMLSKEVRHYKGEPRETDLAKRAKRILEKAKRYSSKTED